MSLSVLAEESVPPVCWDQVRTGCFGKPCQCAGCPYQNPSQRCDEVLCPGCSACEGLVAPGTCEGPEFDEEDDDDN